MSIPLTNCHVLACAKNHTSLGGIPGKTETANSFFFGLGTKDNQRSYSPFLILANKLQIRLADPALIWLRAVFCTIKDVYLSRHSLEHNGQDKETSV